MHFVQVITLSRCHDSMFTKQVYKHSSTFPAHARMKYQCLHVQEAVGAGCRVQGTPAGEMTRHRSFAEINSEDWQLTTDNTTHNSAACDVVVYVLM